MKYSIVIPAYKPHSLLLECLSRIHAYTDLTEGEVIVVCNGSERESAEFVLNLENPYHLVWYKKAIGFTHAANIGMSVAQAPYIILMNTDSFLEPNYDNEWINRILAPFEDPQVGIAGVNEMSMEWGIYFNFFFVGIRKSMLDKIGMLDMRFNPGYGEDADLCFRARANGYKTVNIATILETKDGIKYLDYPITHRGEGSFTNKELRNKCCENQFVVLREIWGDRKL